VLPEAELYNRYLCDAADNILATHDGLSVEELNWRPIAGDTSSLYILGVHIIGNVRQGIVTVLGGRGEDSRVRDLEFSAEAGSLAPEHSDWINHQGGAPDGWANDSVIEYWEQLRGEVNDVFAGLTEEQLERVYSHPRRGEVSGRELCLIMAVHANEHVGHAELTRQLIIEQRS
jgi:hypothetical protein